MLSFNAMNVPNLKVLYQSRIELTWRLADYCNDNIETRLRLQTEGTDWQTVLGAEGCLRLLATCLTCYTCYTTVSGKQKGACSLLHCYTCYTGYTTVSWGQMGACACLLRTQMSAALWTYEAESTLQKQFCRQRTQDCRDGNKDRGRLGGI